MDVLRSDDPELLYRVADALDQLSGERSGTQRDVDLLRGYVERIKERVEALERKESDREAEARGRRDAIEEKKRQRAEAQESQNNTRELIKLGIVLLSLLGSGLGIAWMLLQFAVKWIIASGG